MVLEVVMQKSSFSKLIYFYLITVLIVTLLPVDQVQATATTYRVKTDGVNTGQCGTTWAEACSLQFALNLSTSGDQIWVANGTYKPTSGTDRSVSFALKDGVQIYGGFTGNETSLDQRDIVKNPTILSGDIGIANDKSDNSYHVVYTSQLTNTTTIDGFTIKDGNANGTYPYSRGGGFFNYQSSINLMNLKIEENSAIDLGGGIYNYGGSPELQSVQFFHNESQNRGGGIYNYSSDPSLENIIFIGNHAKELGGGINSYDSNISLSNITFTNNNAGNSGGGMFAFGGSFQLTNATFEGNSAKGGGGLYNTWYSNGVLKNVQFKNNSALERGGGMYNYLSASKLDGVTFTNNTANQYGGGMFIGDSSPILDNVIFTGNSTEDKGGAITNNASNPFFTNVTFTGNTAKYGGGIYNFDYSSPVLTNVTFTNNQATLRGGGMFGVTSSNFTLVDVTFTGNTAQDYGGGIFTDGSTPSLTRVRFIDNNAQKRGGGIYSSGSALALQDVSFSGNSSIDGGGMNKSGGDATLVNVTFTNNTAIGRGGGFFSYLGDTKLTNVTFSGNSAQTYGGGIFNSTGNLTIKSGTFSTNNAYEYGGGVAMDETGSQIVNSIFWQNSAGLDGDQIHGFDPGEPTISYSIVESGCPDSAVCSNVVSTDPELGMLGDHGGFTQTIPILEGSPAIDTGNDSKCHSTDQRGTTRPQGLRCDIGAYESNFENIPIGTHSPDDNEKLTTSKVTFTWNEVPEATEYIIRLSKEPNFSTLIFKSKTADTSFGYTNPLKFNQKYYWQIRPVFGDVKGAWSQVFWFYSMDPLNPPDLISPLHKENLPIGEVNFSWSPVNNGAQYKIVVANDSEFKNIVITKTTSELSAVHALPDGKYYWRVRAIDASGGKGPWSNVFIFKLNP